MWFDGQEVAVRQLPRFYDFSFKWNVSPGEDIFNVAKAGLGHFVPGQFVPGHFVQRIFRHRTFRPRTFRPRTFRPQSALFCTLR